MELVPLNRIKWLSTWSHPKLPEEQRITKIREFSDYNDAVQWYSNIITQSFHYLFGYKTCETGHSELPSLKNSTTNSNAGLSLVFHLPHSPSDYGLTGGSFGWDQCTRHLILLNGTNSILRTFLGGTFRKKHPVQKIQ